MTGINYDKIFDVIEKTLASPSLYFQSLSLISCFVIAYYFYRIGRKFLSLKESKKNAEFNKITTRYIFPLLYPTLTLALLSLGLVIYLQFFKEAILISTTIKFLTLFLFLRFMRISSRSTFIANAVGFVLMPALILHIFDMLPVAIEYLDSLAFTIGSVKISLYLALKAFIVALTVFWLASLISRKSRNYIEKNRRIQSNTKGIIIKFIDILVYTGVIIILLKTFGVDMTAFAVVGGAIGVGIGFGLQKIASNFISGIILLFEKSIEIGDLIELENGTTGKIKHFSGRYTLIEGFDGKEIFLPNEDLITGRVTNWTHSNTHARVEVNLNVAHGSDLKKVKEIMISCAKQHPRCSAEPEIECFLTHFGESDAKFTLYFWVEDVFEGRAGPRSDVLMQIAQELQKNGIELAVPLQRIIERR